MLALAFFVSVFSTVSWLIYTFMYIGEKLNGVSFSSLGLVDISVYTSLVLLPILVLWMVFGYINQYLLSNTFNKNLYSLFKQMKKNQDYTDLIARIMLEAEQEIKDGFILSKFDIFISDMNELLSETIHRSAIASSEQIERLWNKVQNGGKWSFGKVIVEVSQNQPNFQQRIFDKSRSDTVLAGTILEFCARYGSLVSLLEKHDKERVFLNIIETGIFGKVFSIMAPIADEIRRNREAAPSRPAFVQNSFVPDPEPVFEERETEDTVRITPKKSAMPYVKPAVPVYRKTEKTDIKSFISSINPFKKKNEHFSKEEPKMESEADPFSMALKRSFGEEPVFEEPKVSIPSYDEASASVHEISLPEEPETSEIHISRNNEEHEKEFFISAPDFEPEKETSSAPVFYRETSAEKIEEPAFSSTQKALNNLKKEWAEMKKAEEPVSEKKTEENETTYSYPFGGWTDEENYSK